MGGGEEMATKKGRAWKLERANVRGRGSNKYRPQADASSRPAPGTRKVYWRAGYVTKTGKYVPGRYQRNPHYRGRRSKR